MSRKKRQQSRVPETDWFTERTLADAEASAEHEDLGNAVDRCACGSDEFLLEAYMHVVSGVLRPEPVEVETLTCPACGREYEAILGESGRILRGDYLGQADLDDDDDDD